MNKTAIISMRALAHHFRLPMQQALFSARSTMEESSHSIPQSGKVYLWDEADRVGSVNTFVCFYLERTLTTTTSLVMYVYPSQRCPKFTLSDVISRRVRPHSDFPIFRTTISPDLWYLFAGYDFTKSYPRLASTYPTEILKSLPYYPHCSLTRTKY